MGSSWSDEVTILVSPFRGYEAIAREPSSSAGVALARRAAIYLGTVGVVGSLTTVGRLVAAHIASIALAWAFVPVLHALTVLATTRSARAQLRPARAIELHMAGNGPYLVFFFALAAIVIFSPDVAAAFGWLVDSYMLVIAVVAMLVGGGVTSFAFYRVCAGASRRRASALLALEWLVKVTLALGWYAFMDNLAPQFLGGRG